MDVNERARETWTERTDGAERVRSVLERTREPESAAEIAERALVSEKTARKHLERLAEMGIGRAVQDGATTRYERDPEAELYRRIRELRDEYDRGGLLDLIERLRGEVEAYREQHGVDTPEALAAGLPAGDADAAWQDLSEWRTAERDLAFAQAALSFDRAADRVEA